MTETQPSAAFWRKKWQDGQPKKPKEPDASVQRDLEPGWLLNYLWPLEKLTCGRWEYWAQVQSEGSLPEAPIPPLHFCGHRQDAAPGHKMLTRCLNAVAGDSLNGDGWMGWSSFDNFDYLLDWMLFGFGHPGHEELREEPTRGASMRLYQLLDLSPLLLWPYDHFGDLLAECRHGRHNGFYPTPQHIVELMAKLTLDGQDCRAQTVCDPCVGTGRMLLHAAGRSLRLYGQDIDRTMCKATLVNGYLYAPWLVRPIWWLDGTTLRHGNALLMEPGRPVNGDAEADEESRVAREYLQARSEMMVEQSPPHYQQRLFETEFDEDGTRETFPVLKRRKKSTPRVESTQQMELLEV